MAFGLYEFPHSHNYDSDLRELIDMVNQFRDDYNTILDDVTTIRSEFDQVEEDFKALTDKVDGLFTYVDSRLNIMFSEYKSEIDSEILDIQNEVAKALNEIADILPQAMAYTDVKIDSAKREILRTLTEETARFQQQIEDLRDRIKNLAIEAQNPFTGFTDNAGTILEFMNRHFRVHALTDFEYSDLGLTNDEYDKWMLTNWQYLIEGKKILQQRWFMKLNPVTGQLTTDYNIHSYLAGLILGTLTADDYAEQNLTNDEYEALGLSDEDYFFTRAENLPWSIATPTIGD